MLKHTSIVRVRYGETDQMGYAYYGVYAQYYEVGRVEMLRSLGITYKELEDTGYLLPVHSFKITYHKPAVYDDLVSIETTIADPPGLRLRFLFEARNEKGELLNEGEVVLVFVSKITRRPVAPPDSVLKVFKK
ncbi:MAG: acyl-CoA thioesterase [Bacteroidia bacterium]|nr:acyl-CoA thioesterase [Bacteroidia bacterium]